MELGDVSEVCCARYGTLAGCLSLFYFYTSLEPSSSVETRLIQM